MTIAGTAQGAANNPLIDGPKGPYGTLPLSRLTAADFEEGVMEGIRLQNEEIEAIVNQRSIPTFENTIEALDRSGEVLTRSVLALSNLESALGDTVLMNTLAKLTPAISAHSTEIMLNQPLMERIRQVYDNLDKDTSLTPEQRRLTEKTYMNFLQSGALLKGADREKYGRLSAELSDLNVKFSQNVSNAIKDPARRLWLKESDLTGIPESIKTSYRAAAAETLKEDGKEDDGTSYLVTILRPSYAPFLMYSTRRDLREKLYRLNGGTNNSGEFDNSNILKDIANVRLEIANLLGNKNYAEYSLKTTMAKDPKTVMEFLENLRTSYTDAMRQKIRDRSIHPDNRIENIQRIGCDFHITYDAGEAEWVQLPAFWYIGYAVEHGGSALPLRRDEDGQVSVQLPANAGSAHDAAHALYLGSRKEIADGADRIDREGPHSSCRCRRPAVVGGRDSSARICASSRAGEMDSVFR